MTEGEENIIIKGVLLEAISRDFSEELSNNKEVSVSPRFKRQMMAMMNNPNKWAERHKRDYRRRFVKVVATIISQEERIHQECYLWDSWKYEQ